MLYKSSPVGTVGPSCYLLASMCQGWRELSPHLPSPGWTASSPTGSQYYPRHPGLLYNNTLGASTDFLSPQARYKLSSCRPR